MFKRVVYICLFHWLLYAHAVALQAMCMHYTIKTYAKFC